MITTEQDLFYDRMVSSAAWDDVTNPYETARRLHVVFAVLLKDVPLAGRALLDGGSGGGHFSAEAARRGAVVTSVDVGENLLAQVAKRCDTTRVLGSLLDLPFETASFDVVMSTEVIEHTEDPERALGELARVLKPGGTLVVTTPGRLWQPVVRLASALRLRSYQGRENFLWPKRAAAVLAQAGVQVDELRGFNLLPLFHPSFERVLRRLDRFGAVRPEPYVNFGLRGTKATG